jgi:hypothetical protein
MTRIRIHNPCNENTRYFRYYNYFWDKFTDFLKTKFEVEENRYFENAHSERFEIKLEKGISDKLLILECEYVIENLDNGEFVILSVSDELYGGVLDEKENYYLKKVLISQFIPEKIERHTREHFHKYSPWTYFQCAMDDLELYREKRKSIENKIEKMYFCGDERNRPILNYFDSIYLENPERTYPETYFDDLIKYEIGLSIGGVGEMCYRDIEYMALEIPFIRFEYQTELSPKLIPNYHYISIPLDDDVSKINMIKCDRIGNHNHVKKIESKFREVIKDKQLLKTISSNARRYYEENITMDNLVKNTFNLLELENWLPTSNQ